jgi:hypothetical protein
MINIVEANPLETWIARASTCGLSHFNNRPVSGFIEFNANHIKT